MLKVCTSSEGKFLEFQEFLKTPQNPRIQWIKQDLAEPDADAETIVRFKASQFENVLIDDTSLQVEGSNIGELIKWKMSELASLEGRRAEFLCYLGIHRNAEIEIYLGRVAGTICKKDGEGFGFNPYFRPVGAERSFAIHKPNDRNARYLACKNFENGNILKKAPPLKIWSGKFQN